MESRTLAASILQCKPEEILGFADLRSLGRVVVVGPDGKKHRFTYAQLAEEECRLADLRLAAVLHLPEEVTKGWHRHLQYDAWQSACSKQEQSAAGAQDGVVQPGSEKADAAPPPGLRSQVKRLRPATDSPPGRRSPKRKTAPKRSLGQ